MDVVFVEDFDVPLEVRIMGYYGIERLKMRKTSAEPVDDPVLARIVGLLEASMTYTGQSDESESVVSKDVIVSEDVSVHDYSRRS